MDTQTQALRKRVRWLIVFFIAALAVSGITAFPLQWEIGILIKLLGPGTFMDSLWPSMAE